MQRILISLLVVAALLFANNPLKADSLTEYKVDEIVRPKLSFENFKPLIIKYHYVYNGNKINKEEIVCTPLAFAIKSGDLVDFRVSYINYYDAVERPDKKGFILFKTTLADESSGLLEEVIIYNDLRKTKLQYNDENTIIFTKQNNIIALTRIHSIFEGIEGDEKLELHCYDLNKEEKKPFETRRVKLSELEKLGYKIVSNLEQ